MQSRPIFGWIRRPPLHTLAKSCPSSVMPPSRRRCCHIVISSKGSASAACRVDNTVPAAAPVCGRFHSSRLQEPTTSNWSRVQIICSSQRKVCRAAAFRSDTVAIQNQSDGPMNRIVVGVNVEPLIIGRNGSVVLQVSSSSTSSLIDDDIDG